MLFRVWPLLLAVASLLLARPAGAQEPLAHERYSLDNGLDVILHVDRRLPIIAVDLTYHVGSMHDGDRPGLAHLVEHLMFRGSRYAADAEHERQLFAAGALGTNASTSLHNTSYQTLVPRDALPLALWLESERMANLRSIRSAATVEQEVATTIDEWELRVHGSRRGLAVARTWDALFPQGHPFHPAEPAEIRQRTAEDAQAFVARYHGPANATLVLAGDLPDNVREQVLRAFGERRGGTRPAVGPAIASLSRGAQTIEQRAELSTPPAVVMAWPTAGLYEPGDADADVLMTALRAGILEQKIRAHLPDTIVNIQVQQASEVGQSVFFIAAEGVTTATPKAMATAIDAVLDEVRAQPLSDAQIRRARRILSTDLLRNIERMDARARALQAYTAAGKDPNWLDEDIARFDAVTPATVHEFVRTALRPDNRVVILYAPAEAR